jgi:murein DD-endopeptidase MepM/ murein hydrolase activator NlpD
MTHKKQFLGSFQRFILILTGLVMLQLNVPVQSRKDIVLSADFSYFQYSGPGLYQLCSAVIAAATSELARIETTGKELFSGIAEHSEEPGKSKSFKIVKIASIRSNEARSWPVKGLISSGFGMRKHPVTKRNSFHNGIDIKARQGTSILSPADGVVVSAGHAGLMGRTVKIKTRAGKILYFGHMHKIQCRKGDVINKGQLLGTVGSSGRATGPHLHFSVVSEGKYLNPIKYLSGN